MEGDSGHSQSARQTHEHKVATTSRKRQRGLLQYRPRREVCKGKGQGVCTEGTDALGKQQKHEDGTDKMHVMVTDAPQLKKSGGRGEQQHETAGTEGRERESDTREVHHE